MADDTVVLVMSAYGLNQKKAQQALSVPEQAEVLLSVIKEAGITTKLDKNKGALLYTIATKFPRDRVKARAFVAKQIVEGKLATEKQVQAALEFFSSCKTEDFDVEEFKKACGVGVHITKEQILAELYKLFEEKKQYLEEKGAEASLGEFTRPLSEKLKWVEQKDLITVVKTELEARFGTKNKPKPKEQSSKSERSKAKEENEVTLQDSVLKKFKRPEENIQKTPELLARHLAATGGRVVTRFPPEPNGYLHIGHAKSMNLNFGYAKSNNGWCYMRFDDTNPEAESLEYIRSILENVTWLGHTPYQVTYASDYFEQLYQFAVELIKRGKAFVCHQTADEMHACRERRRKTGKVEGTESPWRNRPVEESLRLFEDMRKGKFEEGQATLRMKQDMASDNPCMWDHVAYRIKYTPHPHVGDGWCIYPSYDFTHCLCDSLENITHSLCTLEFEVRRESYNWLVDSLDLYRAPQIEYSRLNITHTVLSKRKLIQLVSGKYVRGWDDPRMYTINGLRRRGYTPEAINDFCERIGITRAPNNQKDTFLEECLRQDLDPKVPRIMAVLHPLRVVITNYPEGKVEHITVPNHPSDKSKGTHIIPFSRVLYIERDDFRPAPEPGFFRLTPGAKVHLKNAYDIECTEVITDPSTGQIVELRVTYDRDNTAKPKGVVHWVAEPQPGKEPMAIEVRLYERLFKTEFPGVGPNGEKYDFLLDINPNSEVIIPKAYIDSHAAGCKPGDKFQFERVGYFCMDPDSTPEKQVWNRTVTLKDSYAKEVEKIKGDTKRR